MRRASLLALACSLATGPALADPPWPSLIPTHDVTGTYLSMEKDGTKTIGVEYSASLHMLRLSPSGGATYILYDFTARDAKIVMPAEQRYMDEAAMTARFNQLQTPPSGTEAVTLSIDGSKTIAGRSCTVYRATKTATGEWHTLCLTDDHILLEIKNADGGDLVAQSVADGPVPDADMQLPAGYSAFQMPQMPPGMSMPPQ